MEQNETLDDFFSRFEQIRAQGDPALTLRWSGEELAMASERLRTAADDKRDSRGAELLVIAHVHTAELAAAGMTGDALATECLAVVTAIIGKANPEHFPGLYLDCLTGLCGLTDSYMQSLPGPEVLRAGDMATNIIALFIVTAHEYIPRFGASDTVKDFYSYVSNQFRKAGLKLLFRGMPMKPQMAVDILADAAARLKSLGVEIG